MHIRITDDGNERDIHEIHEMLRDYNLRHREASENVPLGVFLEDETGRKFAGLTGETFGNWLCIRFLFVGEAFRGRGSAAGCWRLRKMRPGSAAANTHLWTPFPFRRPHFTKSMDTGRFLPSRTIRTPKNGIIIRKRCDGGKQEWSAKPVLPPC